MGENIVLASFVLGSALLARAFGLVMGDMRRCANPAELARSVAGKVFACFLLCSLLLTGEAFAQGTVSFANSSSTQLRTNSIAIGGTAGPTSPTLGGFKYALLTAPLSVTNVDASGQDLLTSIWTFTGLYATNIAATQGGRLFGGSGVPTGGTSWPPDTTNSFVVVGWSTDLGSTWDQISAQLSGAALSGGVWYGTNWTGSGGFFGITTVGWATTAGGSCCIAPNLFGVPSARAMPIGTSTDMFVIHAGVPEPSTIALASLGAAALLLIRSRK